MVNKSARNWFEELPSPVKEQALFNLKRQRRNGKDSIGINSNPCAQFNSAWQAIRTSFVFSKTPEGEEYWNDLLKRIK